MLNILFIVFVSYAQAKNRSNQQDFSLFLDIMQPQDKTFGNWSILLFPDDHTTWPSFQPPNLWINNVIQIPLNATAFQITAIPPNGNLNDNRGGYFSAIERIVLNYHFPNRKTRTIGIDISYYNVPFKMYIGWK